MSAFGIRITLPHACLNIMLGSFVCPLMRRSTSHFSLSTEVVIGFEQTMYEFQENGGFATVRFGVLQGTLRIPVSVSFDLMPGTAEGKEGGRGGEQEGGGEQ
jgi:hypothetical protein